MTVQTLSTPLPAILEHTAAQVFASFSERLRAALHGRQERGLKLAIEGHVTHKSDRIFSVRSESGDHVYLVDLSKNFCTCPDSQKGYICKHRIAAYLVEQASKAVQPEDNPLERARLVLHARSDVLSEAIVYASIQHNGAAIQVEVISLEGEKAIVRALPVLKDGKLVPQFPFDNRQCGAQILAHSLTDITIYR